MSILSIRPGLSEQFEYYMAAEDPDREFAGFILMPNLSRLVPL